MVRWIRTRQLMIITAVVGALLIGGAGAVLAAQNYAGPGATRTQASASDATETTQVTPESTAQQDQDHDQDDTRSGSDERTVSGVIQAVSMDTHRFVLLPDGQQAAVTVAFDTKTEIDQEQGTSPLAAGAHVVVEVVKQADGTLYADEIHGSQQGGDDQGTDGGEHDHQGQPTPTPGSGD